MNSTESAINKFNTSQESLVIQHSDFSLKIVSDMINDNIIDLNPHYQRRNRWTEEKQSKLIESFILNVPVPPIYFSEDQYGIYSVIDGKQRLTAIHDFLNNRFNLKNLEVFSELNGFSFTELPIQIKNALSMRPYIRIVTLLKQSNPQLKYEVFLRLNTGGDALRPQEIRNVAFDGALNELLYKLSENSILRNKLKITDHSSNSYRKMDDLETILRFFSLYTYWKDLPSQAITKVMDVYMSKNRNLEQSIIDSLKEKFTKSITICNEIWQDNAFYKPISSTVFREQFIAPLYDAQMIAVCMLIDQGYESSLLNIDKNKLLNETLSLFESDNDFIKSVTQATNNAFNINKRITTIYDLLRGLV